jgi:hypothetical protein
VIRLFEGIFLENLSQLAQESAKPLTNSAHAHPAGNPIYRVIMTDEFGCFEDFHAIVEGGRSEVRVNYPGNNSAGGAVVSVIVDVWLRRTGDQDHDGVPDSQEVQDEDDEDGQPNHLDPDSDNDGIIDGKEPPGDADQDAKEKHSRRLHLDSALVSPMSRRSAKKRLLPDRE